MLTRLISIEVEAMAKETECNNGDPYLLKEYNVHDLGFSRTINVVLTNIMFVKYEKKYSIILKIPI